MTQTTSRATTALLVALFSAATIAAYSNALDGPFVFDDRLAITDNPHIRSLDPPWGPLVTPRDTPVAGRPVVNLSLAINYALGGLDPRGYRAFNLAIHLVCGLLLFGLVRRTLGASAIAADLRRDATGIATATTLLWLVHPLGSECVDYATQRTESIMAAFYLLTLYGVARVATASRPSADRAWSVLAVAACALGGASKESMLTAPLVALFYDAVFHAGSVRAALIQRRWLYAGLGASMLVVVVIVLGAPRAHSVGASQGVPPWVYLANQSEMLVAYLQRVVWPDPLILDYGWPRRRSLVEWLPSLGLAAGFVTGVLALTWRHPALGFPALAGLIVLAPTSSVVPIVTEVGAERRMYLPLAGLLVLIVLAGRAGLSRIAQRELRQALTWMSVAMLVAIFVLVTRARNEDYLDEATLWRGSALARPANPRARLNLGAVLRRRGELDAADALFVEALTLHPPYGRAEAQRALVALTRGDRVAGEAHLRRALSLEPRLGDVRTNLGELLARSGRIDEALAQWREALTRDPELALAANNLAWTLATHPDARIRDPAEAVHLAERAAELSAHNDPAILDTLAAAQAEAGQLASAIATAERAAELADAVGNPALARAIRTRAQTYRGGRPHRESVGEGASKL